MDKKLDKKVITRETIEWFDPEEIKPDHEEKILICYTDGSKKDGCNIGFTRYAIGGLGLGYENWGDFPQSDYWAKVKGPRTAKIKNIKKQYLKNQIIQLDDRLKKIKSEQKVILEEKQKIENEIDKY